MIVIVSGRVELHSMNTYSSLFISWLCTDHNNSDKDSMERFYQGFLQFTLFVGTCIWRMAYFSSGSHQQSNYPNWETVLAQLTGNQPKLH